MDDQIADFKETKVRKFSKYLNKLPFKVMAFSFAQFCTSYTIVKLGFYRYFIN